MDINFWSGIIPIVFVAIMFGLIPVVSAIVTSTHKHKENMKEIELKIKQEETKQLAIKNGLNPYDEETIESSQQVMTETPLQSYRSQM